MRRTMWVALVVALAVVAVVGVYAFTTAAGQRAMTGQIELVGGPTGEDCDAQSFVIVLEGTGTLAHMGRVDISARNCNDGDLNVEDSQILDGNSTFTAADGSTVSATYEGDQQQPDSGSTIAPFTTVHTVTGGTGRFANARGSWTIAGTVDLSTGQLLGEVSGWLSY